MKTVRTLIFFLGFAMVGTAAANQGGNASGLWQEGEGEHDYKVSIFHKGETIHVIAVGTFRGQKVVWYGHGTAKGNQLEYDYELAMAPSDWVGGHHSLTLSADGKSMVGTWKDKRGASGSLTRKRIQ